MDPLSISASIVALVQLTGTVVEYLHGMKGASEDRQNILSELTSVLAEYLRGPCGGPAKALRRLYLGSNRGDLAVKRRHPGTSFFS